MTAAKNLGLYQEERLQQSPEIGEKVIASGEWVDFLNRIELTHMQHGNTYTHAFH